MAEFQLFEQYIRVSALTCLVERLTESGPDGIRFRRILDYARTAAVYYNDMTFPKGGCFVAVSLLLTDLFPSIEQGMPDRPVDVPLTSM
jgi:hypothetical protein